MVGDPGKALADGRSLTASRGDRRIPLSSAEDLAALGFFEGDRSQLGALSQPELAQALSRGRSFVENGSFLHAADSYRRVVHGLPVGAMCLGSTVPVHGVQEALVALTIKSLSSPEEVQQVFKALPGNPRRVMQAVAAELPPAVVEEAARLDCADYKPLSVLFERARKEGHPALLAHLAGLGPRLDAEIPGLTRLASLLDGEVPALLEARSSFGREPLEPELLETARCLSDDRAGWVNLYGQLEALKLTTPTVRNLERLARNLSGGAVSDSLEFASWCQCYDSPSVGDLQLDLPPLDLTGLRQVSLNWQPYGLRLRDPADDHPVTVPLKVTARLDGLPVDLASLPPGSKLEVGLASEGRGDRVSLKGLCLTGLAPDGSPVRRGPKELTLPLRHALAELASQPEAGVLLTCLAGMPQTVCADLLSRRLDPATFKAELFRLSNDALLGAAPAATLGIHAERGAVTVGSVRLRTRSA